jgi:hypothetical protein
MNAGFFGFELTAASLLGSKKWEISGKNTPQDIYCLIILIYYLSSRKKPAAGPLSLKQYPPPGQGQMCLVAPERRVGATPARRQRQISAKLPPNYRQISAKNRSLK